MKRAPCLIIGRADARQDRDAGGNRRLEIFSEPFTKCFSSAKPIDYNEINAIINGALKDRLSLCEAGFVKATTAGAWPPVFPDVKCRAGSEIDNMRRRRAVTTPLARRDLGQPTNPHAPDR